MRVLVSGASGIVGRFLVAHLAAQGETVIAAGRQPPALGLSSHAFDYRPLHLDPDRDQSRIFEGVDVFVHAAFQHIPGRYRGGEGTDPDGFRRANADGTIRLFEEARAAGVARCLFLSSRAVYGRQPPGTHLAEDMPVDPVSLYGIVKLEAERALAGLDGENFVTASLRATGVYGAAGPGRDHKWSPLIADFLAGRPVEDRVGTEVHGDDLAAAVHALMRVAPDRLRGPFNVSDVFTSHREILAMAAEVTGCVHPLPAAADRSGFCVMRTDRLQALGWLPGGQAKLVETVRRLCATP